MQIRLFGTRLLVEYLPPSKKHGRIILPDVAQKHDTHRMGLVKWVGEACKLVKVGDTVCFQVNDVMSWAQTYKRLADGDPMIHLLESEIIGRIHGDDISLDTFEVMGDFVLVKAEVRRPTSAIVLPEEAVLTPDMLHYVLVQKGQTVDLPIEKGQEIIINHGRVSRMYVTSGKDSDNGKNVELGYTTKEWVHGAIEV